MSSRVKVLVVGDSYANFGRFENGILQGFAHNDITAHVKSFSMPGHTTRQLNDKIQQQLPYLAAEGPYTYALIVAGVNDVVQRRGAKRYARDTERLVGLLSQLATSTYVMQIVHFDEFADISGFLGRLKHKINAFFWCDRNEGRIERYVSNLVEAGCVEILRTDDFISDYEPGLFKDGIHLTDAAFRELALHIGHQLAKIHRELIASK